MNGSHPAPSSFPKVCRGVGCEARDRQGSLVRCSCAHKKDGKKRSHPVRQSPRYHVTERGLLRTSGPDSSRGLQILTSDASIRRRTKDFEFAVDINNPSPGTSKYLSDFSPGATRKPLRPICQASRSDVGFLGYCGTWTMITTLLISSELFRLPQNEGGAKCAKSFKTTPRIFSGSDYS